MKYFKWWRRLSGGCWYHQTNGRPGGDWCRFRFPIETRCELCHEQIDVPPTEDWR